MPVALASSIPQGLVQPLIPLQNKFNLKLKKGDPLLQIGQKKCMVGVFKVFGWAGSLLSWVVGCFGFRVSQVSITGSMGSC